MLFKKNSFLLIIFLNCILLTASCDKDQSYDKAKAKPAYLEEDDLLADSNLKDKPIVIDYPTANSQFLGLQNYDNQTIANYLKNYHYKKNNFFSKKEQLQLTKTWSKSFLHFFEKDQKIYNQPVVYQQKIYFLDGSANLYCYDLITKKLVWKKSIFHTVWLKNYRSPNITISDNKIFATLANNYLVAVDALSGVVIWQKQLSAILTSKPVYSDNMVFVSTDNNKLYCFNATTSDLLWTHFGVGRNTAILGSSSPTIYQDQVLIGYSSGEIYALNKKTSEVVWTQDLNLNKAISSDFYLNDIDASIVVKDDVVYALGNGGLLKAINFKNGNLIWKKQIAGISNFWLANDYLFLINNENKLMALNKNTASVKWLKQLPAYQNPQKPATKIIYNGVIIAGDKLLISSVVGDLILASIQDGVIEKTFKFSKKISHNPIVVNDRIYFLGVGNLSFEIIELM